jgi:hypothetical protein
MRRGVVIRTVINNFTFDGSTEDPMQQAVRDALIAFMAATARAQAEATKAAQRAGIEHAKANDGTAYLGRKPSYTRQQFAMVNAALDGLMMHTQSMSDRKERGVFPVGQQHPRPLDPARRLVRDRVGSKPLIWIEFQKGHCYSDWDDCFRSKLICMNHYTDDLKS